MTGPAQQPAFSWGPLSDKQRMVLSWWCSGSPYAAYDGIIADGAIRSGKTVSLAFSFVLWAMAAYNGQTFALCGKTIASLRRNVLTTLRRQLAGRGYERFIRGRWVVAQGLVYPFVAADPGAFVLRGPTAGMQGRFYVSVDYGTRNPCSMGLWCVQGKRAVRIRESYYDSRRAGRQRTPEEDYAALEQLAKGYYVEQVVVDPAAAAFIETIRRHGRYLVRPADNDVLNGIRVTAGLLQAGMVLIHESCADTLREFSLYCWDDKARQDAVIKADDHAMDDIRYFCYTILAREFRWADWRNKHV